MPLFLIHLTAPYHHTRHQLVYTRVSTPQQWLLAQTGDTGLMAAAIAAGCGPVVAYVWPDNHQGLMTRIRRQKNIKRFCPICRKEQQ